MWSGVARPSRIFCNAHGLQERRLAAINRRVARLLQVSVEVIGDLAYFRFRAIDGAQIEVQHVLATFAQNCKVAVCLGVD